MKRLGKAFSEPRQKFGTVDQRIGSAMQSVGEVMAIGRTFEDLLK